MVLGGIAPVFVWNCICCNWSCSQKAYFDDHLGIKMLGKVKAKLGWHCRYQKLWNSQYWFTIRFFSATKVKMKLHINMEWLILYDSYPTKWHLMLLEEHGILYFEFFFVFFFLFQFNTNWCFGPILFSKYLRKTNRIFCYLDSPMD